MTFEEKYALISDEFKTAKEIGLAAATLGALARRGLVEVYDSTPKKYRRSANKASKIYALLEENKDDYDTYFTLRKSTSTIGMLCSFSNNTVLDCWGKPYDLTDVNCIEFSTRIFNL